MLKNLKNKIIIINMSLIAIILLIVYAGVLYATYTENNSLLKDRLNTAISLHQRPEDMPEIGDSKPGYPEVSPHKEFYGPAVVVTVNDDNEITQIAEYYAKISENALDQILETALSSKNGFGTIKSMSIMFLKEPSAFGTKIAITETNTLYNAMKSTALNGALVLLLVLAIVFIVSLFLSSLAIKPVKEAWTKQKQFIADASHELKTPLTVILANNNILQGHPEETVSSQKQWIDSTADEASRMKKLIDQMLFLAKSDASNAPAPLSRIDISEIAERAALTFEPVAFEKNVNIKTIIADKLIVYSNAELFDRLIHILLDNAVKHAAGDTEILLALQKNGNKVFLSVNNKGDVIPQEDIPHIFDRFYRADKARTSANETSGYGLGLAIAKSILEKLNGDIVVSSNTDNGTTFTVVFS